MIKRNYFAVILSVIMAFSGICLFEAFAPQAVITAYAASLSAPNVTASNSSVTSVKLSWKKIKGADKYIIYRSTNKSKNFEQIKALKSSAKSYTDSKLTCGKTYYYKVYAVKGKAKSKTKTVKITVAPPKPTAVKAQSDKCGAINISYKAVSGASEYEIYYSAAKTGSYALLGTTKDTSYTHNITMGDEGYYKVKACKIVGKKRVKSAYSSVVNAAALSHEFDNYTVSTPASCTVNGSMQAVCSHCGAVDTKVVEAIGHHDFGSYMVDISAGCATNGSKHATCSRCGAVDTKVIEATNEHVYGDYTITTPATCTENGVKTKACRSCGKTVTSIIKAAGHIYTEEVIPNTCTDDGCTVNTCSQCGYSFKSDFTNPTGHSYNSTITKYPTCISEGEKLYTCSGCGAAYTKSINATGEHDYSKLEIITEPTCTQDGEIKLHCATEGCDAVDPNCTSIAPTEHSYIYESNGEGEHRKICKDCGNIKFSSDGQEYSSCIGMVETEIVDGVQIVNYKCTSCDFYTEVYSVPVDNGCAHENINTDNAPAIEPTCDLNGYTGASICEDCGYIIDCGEIIPALSHNYEVIEPAQAPTCTDTGRSAVEVCSICGEKRDGAVSIDYLPTGHSYEQTVIPPSCISDGYTVQKCTHCGLENMNTASDFVKSAGSHTFDNYTTDEHGYRIYSCTVCGYTETDTTCYIDLSARTVSIGSAAQFTKSASNNDKLLLTYDGVSDYEITGSAENLIIDIDVPDVDIAKICDIKLAGITITNNTLDIINIKNQRTDAQKPKVSISAKVDTVNRLTTLTDGNAIDSECGIELKGRGELVINTAATSISCGAKLTIKNLTIDITSGKRGIDLEAAKAGGTDSDYFNLELAGNAIITISSADDCIRCKNFDSKKLDKDEIDSIVTLNSANGDGIDAKGDNPERKSVALNSGRFTITAGKKLVNVDNKKGGVEFDNTPVVDGTATVNGNKFV